MAADPRRRDTRFGPLASSAGLAPVDRSYWVVPGRLLGGGYPQDPWAPDRLGRLVDAGVDAFVDLTLSHVPGSTDAALEPYGEALAEISPEAVVIRHPIRDMSIPTVADARETLVTIDRLLEDGRTVYVHCWGGIGRTGTIMGCWLVSHGLAGSRDVLDLLARVRRHDPVGARRQSPETPEQRRFVRSWRP